MTDKEILKIISGLLRLKPDTNGIITEQKYSPSPDVDEEWKYHVTDGKLYIQVSAGKVYEWSLRQYIWSRLKLDRVCADYKCQYDNWEKQNEGVPYIETEIVDDSDDGSNPQYSFEFIRRFWSDGDGVQDSLKLIMAEYGMGKSSFCQGVRKLASEEIKEQFLNSTAAFPFVFNLTDYRNKDFDEFIQYRLLRDYGMGLEYKTFVELCQAGVFCVVLDAWDQMNDTPKAIVVRQNIFEFSELWKERGRVLITCRRSFYQNQLRNKKDRRGDYSGIQLARPYTLCGFGRRSVLQYFESANVGLLLPMADVNWVEESWKINSELLARPLNIRLLARHYNEIAEVYDVKAEKVETFGFLRIIHDYWKKRVDEKLGKRDILKSLVILTLESGLYRGVPIDRYRSELNNDRSWDDVLLALEAFDFVSVDENGSGEIGFRLAAYQEFLWAKYVLDELNRKKICDRRNLLNRFMLPPEVRFWIANELRHNNNDCLAWQIANTKYKQFGDVGYSCSNAVTLLRDLNREPFYSNQFSEMKMDFRYRPLNEADLRGLDLSGADFTQSNLINADLSFTNLDGANFSGANVSDAIWDEYDHMEKCAFIDDSVVVGTASGRVLTYNISSRQKSIADLANEMIRSITADNFGVYTAAQDGWVGYISKKGELKNAFISTSGLQSITSEGSGSVYMGADAEGIFRYNWKTGGKQQIITDYPEKNRIADINYYSNCDERYIAYMTGKRRLVLVKLVGLGRGKIAGDVVLTRLGDSFGDICFADNNLIYSVTGRGVYSLPVQEIDLTTKEQHLLSPVRQIYECGNPVELCWADDSREVIIIEKAGRRLDVITCVTVAPSEKVLQREIYWIYGQKNHSIRADSISGFSASSDGRFIALSGEKLIVLKREEDDDYYQLVDKPIEAKISCTNTKFRGCIGLNTYQKEIFSDRNAMME